MAKRSASKFSSWTTAVVMQESVGPSKYFERFLTAPERPDGVELSRSVHIEYKLSGEIGVEKRRMGYHRESGRSFSVARFLQPPSLNAHL
ncbi:MAG: hypothetical protein JWN98_318 [Abditibacteriota bacterium]|nr:hypothetical protein [Abditibacteriota bacterium]